MQARTRDAPLRILAHTDVLPAILERFRDGLGAMLVRRVLEQRSDEMAERHVTVRRGAMLQDRTI
jgi:hypothetical protein